MIYLGQRKDDKYGIVDRYARDRKLTDIVILSPERFRFDHHWQHVEWKQIIKYKTFYRLLREIGPHTLVVVNECLRTTVRSDLTYNCIRHYLSQTTHQLVFQWVPMIEEPRDFLILLDFDTRSRFKGRGLSGMRVESIEIHERTPRFTPLSVPTNRHEEYVAKRDRLFAEIGAKDPHTIPRQLHLVPGKDKADAATGVPLVGRNNRFKIPGLVTYRQAAEPRTVFEFPHNVLEMSDWLCAAEHQDVVAMVTDLKADQWYLDRYRNWAKKIDDAYSTIRERKCS